MAAGVFDLQRYRGGCICGKEIIDYGPVRRIFAGRFIRGQRRICIEIPTYAQSCLRFEQKIFALIFRELAKRCDVIENPESASVCRNHEIVVFESEIANGRGRQIQPQRLPFFTIVERDVNALFCSGEKKTFALPVLADGVHRLAGRDAVDNFTPRPAAVVRAENVRP